MNIITGKEYLAQHYPWSFFTNFYFLFFQWYYNNTLHYKCIYITLSHLPPVPNTMFTTAHRADSTFFPLKFHNHPLW